MALMVRQVPSFKLFSDSSNSLLEAINAFSVHVHYEKNLDFREEKDKKEQAEIIFFMEGI